MPNLDSPQLAAEERLRASPAATTAESNGRPAPGLNTNKKRESGEAPASWEERLHDPHLAQRLSFLRDEQSERLLQGQVIKNVDRVHAALDRQKRKQKI